MKWFFNFKHLFIEEVARGSDQLFLCLLPVLMLTIVLIGLIFLPIFCSYVYPYSVVPGVQIPFADSENIYIAQ